MCVRVFQLSWNSNFIVVKSINTSIWPLDVDILRYANVESMYERIKYGKKPSSPDECAHAWKKGASTV